MGVRDDYEKSTKNKDKSTGLNHSLRAKIECYRDIFSKLITVPSSNSTFPKKEEVRCLKPLSKSIEIITPNVKARATVYSQTVKATDVSQGHIKTCASCKKSHDQHLLAHCDTCKLHYHLGCLTPPLTRMPKKSGHYGWSCSECYPDSSDSNTNVGDVYDDDIEGGVDAATQKRNRKRRLAASKALIANSRRNSSDFETEWPTWTVPKSDGNAYNSGSKLEAGNGGATSHKKDETKNHTNGSPIHSSNTSYSNLETKPQLKNQKNHRIPPERTKSLYEAAANAATALLSTQEPTDLPDLESDDTIEPSKAAKAAAKAQRKQVKKEEKERKKLEEKEQKILGKQKQEMKEKVAKTAAKAQRKLIKKEERKEAEIGSNLDTTVTLDEKHQEFDESEDDV